MIVSIDPGVRECGVAHWNELGELRRAFLCRGAPDEIKGAEAWRAMLAELDKATILREQIIVEFPQVYRRALSKGDPNDLLEVAALVGSLIGRASQGLEIVRPAGWKGQCKKDVTKNRVLDRLTADEIRCIEFPKSKKEQGDVYDAIGIGLWYLKKKGIRT